MDLCLIGAILGDIAGSPYEFYHPNNIELFTSKCFFTDDTVLNIATKEAILENPIAPDFKKWYLKLGKQYPNCSWGTSFSEWLMSPDPQPYNSCGNGSAMRVAYIADYYQTSKEVMRLAAESAAVSHNHPHGLMGAEITALSAFGAKHELLKDDIYKLANHFYPQIKNIEQNYQYSELCQQTVPAAIKMFCKSTSLMDCFERCIWLKGDSDTLCAIAGMIAVPYYGVTEDEIKILNRYCDDYILERIRL